MITTHDFFARLKFAITVWFWTDIIVGCKAKIEAKWSK